MKKFLVICLSVVMLFSTLLLCGFTRGVNAVEKLSVVSNEEVFVEDIFFDTSLDYDDYISSFSSLDFVPIDEFDSIYPVFAFSDNRFLIISLNSVSSVYLIALVSFTDNQLNLLNSVALFNFESSGSVNFETNKLSINSYGISSFNLNGFDFSIGAQNNNISSFIYVDKYITQPNFSKDLISVISNVFTEYVPLLAFGILNMFTGIFWQNGAFTILGYALITLVSIALVSSIFYVVYRIFKGKIKKRL